MDLRTQLCETIQGEILEREPLSRHTSFGIGGPADYFIRPQKEGDLITVLQLVYAHGLPLMVIGRGTNLLVGDGGVRGVVIDLSLACRRLEKVAGGGIVGSGVTVAELLDFCIGEELGGVEFMAGIPGSVGGAVMVNAGAWEQALGSHVKQVRGYSPSGQETILDSSFLEFGYRRSNLPKDLILVETRLSLVPREGRVVQEKINACRQRRRHQPTGQKSAGSVFKNPPLTSAGQLIEQAGCKGMRVDGAEVSWQHANFIVNRGGASASSVRELIEKVRRRVVEQFNVYLELEIICIGES